MYCLSSTIQHKFQKAQAMFNREISDIQKERKLKQETIEKYGYEYGHGHSRGKLLSMEDQKLIILSMALLEFDEAPKSKHHNLLLTIREVLAKQLDEQLIKIINTRNEESENNRRLRYSQRIRGWDYSSKDKDLYEAIGFQNGMKPWTDCRAVGLLGINLLINFFENIQKSHLIFQEQAEERLKKEHAKHKHRKPEHVHLRNTLIDNLLVISQGKPGENSGFPLILAMLNIISMSYDLIYLRPKK